MDSSAAVLDGLTNTIEKQFDPFPDPLGRNIVDLNVWAIQEGLRGSTARELFDGFCQLLVAGGMQLLRGYVSTQPCIRNGAATGTLGGATSIPFTHSNIRRRHLAGMAG